MRLILAPSYTLENINYSLIKILFSPEFTFFIWNNFKILSFIFFHRFRFFVNSGRVYEPKIGRVYEHKTGRSESGRPESGCSAPLDRIESIRFLEHPITTVAKVFDWVISWILSEKTLASPTGSLGPFGISSSFKLINYKKKIL